MQSFPGSIYELNSNLKQLVDIVEDWEGSGPESRSVPGHLVEIRDEIHRLKHLLLSINSQLQQNAILGDDVFDLAALMRIRQGQSAIASLIEAARGSAREDWLLAPSPSIIESLNNYLKGIKNCSACLERVHCELKW
jgi:hypothetical protein